MRIGFPIHGEGFAAEAGALPDGLWLLVAFAFVAAASDVLVVACMSLAVPFRSTTRRSNAAGSWSSERIEIGTRMTRDVDEVIGQMHSILFLQVSRGRGLSP
jgi:hypothetical protein